MRAWFSGLRHSSVLSKSRAFPQSLSESLAIVPTRPTRRSRGPTLSLKVQSVTDVPTSIKTTRPSREEVLERARAGIHVRRAARPLHEVDGREAVHLRGRYISCRYVSCDPLSLGLFVCVRDFCADAAFLEGDPEAVRERAVLCACIGPAFARMYISANTHDARSVDSDLSPSTRATAYVVALSESCISVGSRRLRYKSLSSTKQKLPRTRAFRFNAGRALAVAAPARRGWLFLFKSSKPRTVDQFTGSEVFSQHDTTVSMCAFRSCDSDLGLVTSLRFGNDLSVF